MRTHINYELDPPGVSVDGIHALLVIPHTKPIVGRGKVSNPRTWSPRWIDTANGKVSIRSLDARSVLLRFNPSQLEFGHNLWQCTDRLGYSIECLLRQILPRVPEIRLFRREWTTLRTCGMHISRLDLAADFVFADHNGVPNILRHLGRGWTWPRGKVRNAYSSGREFRQCNWSLVLYDKSEEMTAHNPGMPAWLLRRSAKRLRVEVRLKRFELRTLGARLFSVSPELAMLNLGAANNWRPDLYGVVFDFYAARLRTQAPPYSSATIPLYKLIADLGGRPLWKRESIHEPLWSGFPV